MDRRQLRKLNQFQNKAKQPPPPQDTSGTLGERDPNTGKRTARLDNGGTYPVRELFDSSISENTNVQLNPGTKTADWKDATPQPPPPEPFKRKREIQGRLGTQGLDNPNFANCNVCRGQSQIDLDCYSGLAQIDFEDGNEKLITPGYVVFGNKVKYLTTEGDYGEKCWNACTSQSEIDALVADVGADPESLEFECVVRGYELVRKYRVSWTTLGGENAFVESRFPVGYAIESGDESAGYEPGDRNEGTENPTTELVYDSGIPRKFTVNPGGLSSGLGAYFQIYRYKETPCQYDLVAVTTKLQFFECSGLWDNIPTWETIYTGECGFEIALGDGLREDGQILRVYDYRGEVLLETFDYDPATLQGGLYEGGKEETTVITDPIQDDEYLPLIKFERTTGVDTEGGVKILAVNCVLGEGSRDN